ncbi:MAG: hypothetical protein NWQ13_04175 [Glaciimonas sp.]|nr:hypothetical protein [Glaciimonas sp.]
MSIAVSVLIRSSTILHILVALLCATIAMVGVLIGFGIVGHLLLSLNIALGVICIFSSMAGWLYFRRMHCACSATRINISHSGQIRIAKIAFNASSADYDDTDPAHVETAYLLGGSTLWTHALILRLRMEHGRIKTMIIFPDSVSADAFRALSVALRWIASRQRAAAVENGI